MKPWRFVYKNFLPLLCGVIFISALVPKLFLGGLSTPDDPYYHAAHAAAYYHGDVLQLPQFSPLAAHPTDPWFLYHWGMVPFIAVFASYGTAGVILASKVYHALLVTALFGLFFAIVRSVAVALAPLYKELLDRMVSRTVPVDTFAQPQSIAIAAVIFLFLYDLGSISDFVHRTLMLDRPHVLMITLVMVAFWALVYRRVWTLLAVSAVAALSYSISVLVLLPVCVAVVWWVIGSRTYATGQSTLYALCASVVGLGAGIALHPQSLNYLTSGILIHIYGVYHSLTWWMTDATTRVLPPTEMYLLQSAPTFLQLSAAGSTAFVMYLLYTYRRRSEHPWLLLSFMTAGGIGLIFTLVQIFIPRAVEYSIPFLALTITTTLGFVVVPLLRVTHTKLQKRAGEIGDWYRQIIDGARSVISDARMQKTFSSLLMLLLLTTPILMHSALLLEKKPHDYTQYQEITEYLQTIPNHTLLTDRFDLYPQLIFLAPSNHYTTGMDSRFVGLYDQTLARDIDQFWDTANCTETSCEIRTIPESFRTHHITHILIDETTVGKPLADAIALTPGLQLVVTSARNADIRLYEISEPATP